MSNQCQHGSLARACRICELEQENAELKRKQHQSDLNFNALEKENARLEANINILRPRAFKAESEYITILDHCKDLERIIAESQEQKPYGWFDTNCNQMFFDRHEREPKYEVALFASPVIQEGMVKNDI